MATPTCSNPDCTVAVTGKCLLSHSPLSACPHYRADSGVPEGKAIGTAEEEPPLLAPAGLELGTREAAEIMRMRYAHFIGVLGATDVGKTSLVCSLYLLASCGDLQPRFVFAGSRTLPGFEARLRKLRKWTHGPLPDQIVEHTVLKDPRAPSLLNLAFMDSSRLRRLELLFTDLPGEWTTQLIDRAATGDRLAFLRRVDCLILALEMQALKDVSRRHEQLLAERALLTRLKDVVRIELDLPIFFVLTKCDLTGLALPEFAFRLERLASELGFTQTRLMPVASFSDNTEVVPGTGVPDLLAAIANAAALPISPRTCTGGTTNFQRYQFAE